MSLLYAVALLSVSTVLIRMLYVGSRLPRTPWWASEFTMNCLLMPIIGMISFGAMFLVEGVFSWRNQVIGIEQSLIAGAIVGVGMVIWLLMGRLRSTSTAGSVVPMREPTFDPRSPEARDPSPITPERPRKAA